MRCGKSISVLTALLLALTACVAGGEDLVAVQSGSAAATSSTPVVLTGRDLLRQTVELLQKEDFAQAETLVVDSLGLDCADGEDLRSWLNEYQQFLADRRAQRQSASDEHIGEAQEKLAAGELQEALSEAFLAAKVSPEPEELRTQAWLVELIDKCSAKAEELANQGEYTKAAIIYHEIARILPDDPAWEQRSEQAGLHAGILGAYDKESEWEVRLRDVDPHDFERALVYVDERYVKQVEYRKMFLAMIKGLRTFLTTKRLDEAFERLGDKLAVVEVLDFLDQKTDELDKSTHITAADVKRVYWQIILKNRQGLKLPDAVLVDLLSSRAFAALDDYTEMIWPEQQRWFARTTMGSFSGIGVQIKLNSAKQLEIVTPLDGTPALKAGLQTSDLIVAVDGRSTEGISIDEAVRRITGRKGTKVVLTIRRPGQADEFDVAVVRDVIRIDSVRGNNRMPDNGWNYIIDNEEKIAYVRISNFTSSTTEELDQAIESCREQGAKALILDLRFDPGGTLAAAEDVSDRFLPAGELIVSTRGRWTEPRETKTEKPDSCAGWPVVVLTSDKSASAAEIVAGALQDHDRAFVVGERTYGKGLVQSPFRLRSGFNTQVSIKLTTAYWYLPKGRNVQRSEDSEDWGVVPNFDVELTLEETKSLTTRWASAAIIHSSGLNSTDIPVDPGESGSAEDLTGSDELEMKDLPDPQLATALLVARLELLVSSH